MQLELIIARNGLQASATGDLVVGDVTTTDGLLVLVAQGQVGATSTLTAGMLNPERN